MPFASNSIGDLRGQLTKALVAFAVAFTAIVPYAALTATSAAAQQNQVDVQPTGDLNAAGDNLHIAGSGYADDVGLFIRLCGAPTQQLGDEAGRESVGPCDGQGIWVTNTMSVPGTAPLTDGAFEIDLPVTGAYQVDDGSVIDCMEPESCGVYVRRDRFGAEDFSLDLFIPVTFDAATEPPFASEGGASPAATPTLTLSKSTDLESGETITVNGSGYVPDQGVYVQLCQAPTGGELGTEEGRASRCYPENDSEHIVWFAPVAADGTFSTPLVVERTFTPTDGEEVDCSEANSCVIFTRRDHEGGATDFSQDQFVGISFADSEEAEPEESVEAIAETVETAAAADEDKSSGVNPVLLGAVALFLAAAVGLGIFQGRKQKTT